MYISIVILLCTVSCMIETMCASPAPWPSGSFNAAFRYCSRTGRISAGMELGLFLSHCKRSAILSCCILGVAIRVLPA